MTAVDSLFDKLFLLGTCVPWGGLLASLIVLGPDVRLEQLDRRDELRVMLWSLALSIALWPISFFVNREVVVLLGVVGGAALSLLLLRKWLRPTLSRSRMTGYLVLDVFVSAIGAGLAAWWFTDLYVNGLISPGAAWAPPIAYFVLCFYLAWTLKRLAPNRFLLAKWLILAYSFPEAGVHNKVSLSKPDTPGPSLSRIGEWLLALGVSAAALLVGYRLSGWAIIPPLVFVLVLTVMLFQVLRGSLRKSQRWSMGNQLLFGWSTIVALTWLLLLAQRNGNLVAITTGERFFVGMAIVFPVYFLAVTWIPGLTRKVRRRLPAAVGVMSTIRVLGKACRQTVYSGTQLREVQAALVAGVLLFYFFVPRSLPFLKWAGVESVWGYSINEAVAQFGRLASSSALAAANDPVDLLQLAAGSQGLVLMGILWAIATLIYYDVFGDRLFRVPSLPQEKTHRLTLRYMVFLYFIALIPFLFVTSILIPIVTARVLGEPAAILLGVFAFGLLLPRLLSYVAAMSYLVVVLLLVRPVQDAVDLNSASVRRLESLPGIGRRLARRIAFARPFASFDELETVRGISATKRSELLPLVRVSSVWDAPQPDPRNFE